MKNCQLLEKDQAQWNHNEALQLLNHTNFFDLQCGFYYEQLAHQSKFFRNYMTMFEVLLHFIRASRFQFWELHLESLHAIIPYFFYFNMWNNTRMSPVYFSQMMQMKDHDPAWDLFESGNFLSRSLRFLLQLSVLIMILNRRAAH